MKNLKVLFTVLCVACATTVWGEIADGTYELCTSTADLVAGDHYIIASGNTRSVYCISNETNTNNRKTVSVTVSNETISVDSKSTIMTFTLGGSMGAWTLATDNYSGTAGLLAATSSSKNYLGVVASPGNNGKWEISFSDQKASFTAKGTYTRNVMQYNYNNGSPIFACYASATQSACYLYHKSSGSTETTYSITFDAGTNGTCSTTSLTETSQGSGVTLPSCTPNAGYTFVGWSTSSSATSADAGKAGALYKPTSNCTLYAVYSAIQYTVTWVVGSNSSKTQSYTTQVAHGSKATPPDDLTLTGSEIGDCVDSFVGWSKSTLKSPTNTPPSDLFKDVSPDAITANTTFYAVFATKQQ